MRRRSKPRVVWLPPDISNEAPTLAGNGVTNSVVGRADIEISSNSPIATVEIPLVIDTPRDATVDSLSDIENSGYRLRRIVGNLWVTGDRLDDESGVAQILIEAGIIVRRVDESGTSYAQAEATQSGTQDATSPTALTNAGDPWIWMRSWLIRNPVFFTEAPDVTASGSKQMMDNYGVGLSAQEGSKIDQKTARIVSNEERLFLVVSGVGLIAPGQSDLINTTILNWHIRCLGSLRTSSGNRRNASR